MINILSALTGGCFLLLAFIAAVNHRKVNIIANRLLAVFLLSVAIILIAGPVLSQKFVQQYPILFVLFDSPVFTIGPVIFFCISYFVSPAKTLRKKELWHFLLPTLLILWTLFFPFLPIQEKSTDPGATPATLNVTILLVIVMLPLTVYWILTYKKLVKHQKNVPLFASSTETVDLAWLRFFLWGLAGMMVAWFSEMVWANTIVRAISTCIYLAAAFYLAYFALQQGEVFSEKPQEILELKTIIEENEQIDVPKKQIVTDEQLTVLKDRLNNLMQSEKPYLDSSLSLSKLAQLMQIGTHELSYLINTCFEDNFFNFVNRYRVEESKRLLLSGDYQHLSMIGIAFEAGFNSKTAFNTAFKKMVGMSPSEFQKQNTR